MTTFALIHGGCHTSHCWGLFADELRSRGHRILTVDLPVEDPSAGPDRYLDVTVKAFADAPEPVIAIGHSLAGWTTLRLDGRIPLAGIVLLASIVISPPGLYPDEPEGMMGIPVEDLHLVGGLITWPPQVARDVFYQDLDPDALEKALAAMVPQGAAGMAGPSERIPPLSVPAVYIRAEDDHAVSANWSEWAAVEFTGRPAVVIPGSHSPFLSRPALLADVIEDATRGFDAVVAQSSLDAPVELLGVQR